MFWMMNASKLSFHQVTVCLITPMIHNKVIIRIGFLLGDDVSTPERPAGFAESLPVCSPWCGHSVACGGY